MNHQTNRETREPAPDIIWILTDQQSRWADFPRLGPAASRLAKEGTTVDICQCAAPVCGPSRLSLLTGLPVHRHGLIYNDWGEQFTAAEWERRGLRSAGQRLAEAGYHCEYFGKWHAGQFDPAPGDALPGFRNGSAGLPGRKDLGWDMDGAWTERAMEAWRNRGDGPQFFVLSLHNPHDICYYILDLFPEIWREVVAQTEGLPCLPSNFEIPLQELELAARLRRPPSDPKRFGGREMHLTRDWKEPRWREYLAVYRFLLEKADREIGRFLAELNSSDRGKSAFVLFTSDHGEGCASHKMVAKQSPYRESMEVPLILRWKDRIPAGITESRIVADGLDLLPTSLAAAGLPTDGLPGRSLEYLWSSNPQLPARDFSVSELYPALAEPEVIGRIVRAPNLKYVFSTARDGEEGACLRSIDPEEKSLSRNSGRPEQIIQGRQLLRSWMEIHNDPLLEAFSRFCDAHPLAE